MSPHHGRPAWEPRVRHDKENWAPPARERRDPAKTSKTPARGGAERQSRYHMMSITRSERNASYKCLIRALRAVVLRRAAHRRPVRELGRKSFRMESPFV